LVDRHDSGSCVRKGVEVQVLSRAFLIFPGPLEMGYI